MPFYNRDWDIVHFKAYLRDHNLTNDDPRTIAIRTNLVLCVLLREFYEAEYLKDNTLYLATAIYLGEISRCPGKEMEIADRVLRWINNRFKLDLDHQTINLILLTSISEQVRKDFKAFTEANERKMKGD